MASQRRKEHEHLKDGIVLIKSARNYSCQQKGLQKL